MIAGLHSTLTLTHAAMEISGAIGLGLTPRREEIASKVIDDLNGS